MAEAMNIDCLATLACLSAIALLANQAAGQTARSGPVGNAVPLRPTTYWKLPIGAIRPGGWLRKQLELEAAGFVGHLDQISGFLRREGNAWLSPTGEGHSPWEELPYWLKGFGDLGYVLGDRRIVSEAKVWLEAAMGSQRPSGYFGPQANLTGAGGKPDMWPNMLMLNALQSSYEFSGDRRVIELMTRYFQWQLAIPEDDFLSGAGPGYWQRQRAGDNLASVYWLYNRTKDKWLLDLADKIHRRMADWSTGVHDWHGVNFAQCFKEPAVYFQQSGKPDDLRAAARNLEEMRGTYGQVPGGMYGADENARKGYVDPRQATETCSFVEMMLSDEMLVAISSDLSWADRCEDVAFNSFPASMTPDLKALRYLTAPNMILSDRFNKSPGLQNGGPMLHYDPSNHRCCQHNVAMGWPYFAEHLWMATPDHGLAAILYADSTVKAKVGAGKIVTVREDTRYPFDESVRLTVSLRGACRFPLRLRVPSWCKNPTVKVNGKTVKPQVEAGMLVLSRTWANGDQVTLDLPMPITFNTWAKNMNSVSVHRGPLTYSLKIGERYVRQGGTDQWPAWEVHPETPWNYGLLLAGLRPDKVKVLKRPWPKDGQPFRWDSAPIELQLKARRLPAWKKDYQGLVGKLQPSPARSSEPTESVTLIPMGCARLRISSFPTIGDGPHAVSWVMPKDPLPAEASFANPSDSVGALSDGILPSRSADLAIPRFTWWDHKGTTEWVQYDFANERTVSSAAVYWFDDTGRGECRVPESWRLLARVDGQWKEVQGASAYGVEIDRMNRVTFSPVKTQKLRLEVKLQSNFSGGILEWEVK